MALRQLPHGRFVDACGRIVWWCITLRFDRLSRGCFWQRRKGLLRRYLGATTSEAAYQRNTAIVERSFETTGQRRADHGLHPLFRRFERSFNPAAVSPDEPIAGLQPHGIRVVPRSPMAAMFQQGDGIESIRYAAASSIALTTDAPLSYIAQESSFALTSLSLIGPETIRGRVELTSREALERTRIIGSIGRALGVPREYSRYYSRRNQTEDCSSRERAIIAPYESITRPRHVRRAKGTIASAARMRFRHKGAQSPGAPPHDGTNQIHHQCCCSCRGAASPCTASSRRTLTSGLRPLGWIPGNGPRACGQPGSRACNTIVYGSGILGAARCS